MKKTGMKKNGMTKMTAENNLPGVELPALEQYDGTISPYANSELRSITTTRVDRLAWESWYQDKAELVASEASPVITCAHPQLELWLRMTEGFDPSLKMTQPPADQWPLTRIIPRVMPGKQGIPFTLPMGNYWIDYGEISSSMKHLPDREWTYKATEQFPDPNRVTLGYIGKHLLSRLIWRQRFALWSNPFFEQFKEGGMVVPDFSAWLDDPRPQALVGERMTQQFAELGCSRGYRMIPTLAWQNTEMLRRVADLFGSMYPQVNTVYLYLTSTGVERTAWLYSRLEDIQAHLSDLPFRFLISGVESGWGINALREALPKENFHLVAGRPWMQARLSFGDNQERALNFRRAVGRMEEWHRGENLPPLRPKPENPFQVVVDEL